MKSKLLLEYSPESGRCRWLKYLDSGAAELPAHTGLLDDFFAVVENQAVELLLVLNSPLVTLRTVHFEANDRKHILKTASYELEESLVSDVDQLHFAYAKPEENSIDIALIDRQVMRELIAPFEAQNIEISAVMPLHQVLSTLHDEEDETKAWLINADERSLTVSLGGKQYFYSDYAHAQMAWQAATQEQDTLPDRIVVYEDSSEAANASEDVMPAALAPLLDAQRKPWFVDSRWQKLRSGAINLLQGEFSPAVAWGKIWQYWRVPSLLFFAGLCIYTLAAFLQNQRLQADNIQLRQEMMAVYQQAFPNSQVSDPEAQMRSKLREISGGKTDSTFIPLFYRAAEALNTFEGLNLLNVNFDSRNNELRADLLAKQFQDLEKIRLKLDTAGIAAELVSSNSVDGGERARMKFSLKTGNR
ncbi:MAG: type II secretion system protein GspL [Pseudomonadales bacterium]